MDNAKISKFVDRWRSYFVDKVINDAPDAWHKWIDESDIDTALQALDIIASRRAETGKEDRLFDAPGLHSIRRLYNVLIEESNAKIPRKAVPICKYCQNRGYGWLVCGVKDGKTLVAKEGKTYDKVYVTKYVCWARKCYAGGDYVDMGEKVIEAVKAEGVGIKKLQETIKTWEAMQTYMFWNEDKAKEFCESFSK